MGSILPRNGASIKPRAIQFDAEHLEKVAVELNERIRKTLDWKSPADALNQLLSTASDSAGVATTN